MRGTDVLCCLIAATLAVLPTFARPDGVEQRTTCDTSSLNSSCKKNERCVEGSNGVQACECNRDFYFDINKKECVKLAPTVTSVNTTDFKPEQRSESEGGGTCTSRDAVTRSRRMLALVFAVDLTARKSVVALLTDIRILCLSPFQGVLREIFRG
ncbi:hypothetical protein PUN28_001101 [Cardiocondyla obscurior]|uniref:Uncharacterized protein n=1 Tax=Cardiocondyla obscurior TaxID=286306 RepID=A0AAW2H2Y1_9HYME